MSSGAGGRRATTVLELMVAITILAIIIVCAGMVFSGASYTAGTSQALMETTDVMSAAQRMLERDVACMDREGFLVIRCRMADRSRGAAPRFDQMSFMAYGTFPNQTGGDDPLHPMADWTVGDAAFIWWGQLVMEQAPPPDPSFMAPNQSRPTTLDQLPTGAYMKTVDESPSGGGGGDNGSGGGNGAADGGIQTHSVLVMKEDEFVLGRHAMVMVPGPPDDFDCIAPAGRVLKAYRDIQLDPPFERADGPVNLIQGAGESKPAVISSSRFSVAGILPREVAFNGDAAEFCYRFQALESAYDSEVAENPLVNGAIRQHAIVMQGVSSLKIDWSDGSVDPETGQLQWFGPTHPYGDTAIERVPETSEGLSGDDYRAVFSGAQPDAWPRALRITYHVVDPSHRLAGGRDVVQVVSLPE